MTISWLTACILATTLFFPPSAINQSGAAPQAQQTNLDAQTLARWVDARQYLALTGDNSLVLPSPIFAYRLSKNAATLDGWSQALGLSLTEVDEPLRAHLRLNPNEGLLVTSVTADGVAARAKLQTHDVILGLPGTVT